MVRNEDLARRLVVRRGANGNCTYDESAKRELIELGQSGVASVAKVALRIPTQTGQPFRRNLDTDSEANWTPIPTESGQPKDIT